MVNEALIKDNSAPLPLIVLKRLTDIGDEEAESYLKESLLHLIATGSDSVLKLLNNEGFLNYLEDLDAEIQLYIAFSSDLDYSTILPHLKSTKIGDLVDKSIQEQFNKIINNFQREKHIWIREEGLSVLKNAIQSFGADAFKGLITLYSRQNQNLQILAVESILKLYREHRNIITNDIKEKLGHFFKEEFKPYYKINDEVRAVERYVELFSEYKKEFNELKRLK